ncbi:MAG: SUMF1/EgtB/PvdO family nonheme iron enzyme, partial [Chloroflexi bacterium]|nr:SUMF1/EgtB/PvdO family nonheme iron enzyme [Chloroflexota bacterium]
LFQRFFHFLQSIRLLLCDVPIFDLDSVDFSPCFLLLIYFLVTLYMYNKCNTSEGGKGITTSVGFYSPQGDSPYRCADMAGNVWEWSHSLKKAYPYNVRDGREDEKVSVARVLRGGSLSFDEWGARCAFRFVGDFDDFFDYFGFRVCLAPPLSK